VFASTGTPSRTSTFGPLGEDPVLQEGTELISVHKNTVSPHVSVHVGVCGIETITSALHVLLPPGPEDVIVYVFVCVGKTVRDPDNDTEPMPPIIVTEVALAELQEILTSEPGVTCSGLALILQVGKFPLVVPVTDKSTAQDPGPPAPDTVRTYLRDFSGRTTSDPPVLTAPIPSESHALDACRVVHDKRDDDPSRMLAGRTVIVHEAFGISGGSVRTPTVVLHVFVPPGQL